MYILSGQIKNLAVISLQTGESVAVTTDPVIDPSKLEIIAFMCRATGDKQQPVLLTQDVRQLTKDALLIDGYDEIEEAAEIIRLHDILDQKFQLIGCRVENESGTSLGKTEDYSLNVETYLINKLYVKRPLLKSFASGSLVIDRTQIVDVRRDKIVVRDATVAELAVVRQPGILPGS